jgi:hypothetical protein
MQSQNRVDLTAKHGPARKSPNPVQREESTHQRPHHLVTLQRSIGNAQVSRMLAQREQAEEEEIMAKHDTESHHASPEVGMEGGQISDDLSSRINSKRGGGGTLDSGTQSRMEQAFGSSFDDVRIHTDSEADSLNRSVSAKAFTTGNDIFFSQQASPNDTQLLAHELTHVVQQRGASAASGPMTVGAAGDSHEVAADSAATSVASGSPVASAQRQEDSALADIAREGMPEEEEMPM